MNLIERLIEELKKDEGYRDKPYKCSEGYMSIGYGFNMVANKLPDFMQEHLDKHGRITREMAETLLYEYAVAAINDCENMFYNYHDLPDDIKYVLGNMMYQMGWAKMMKFVRTRQAVEECDYETMAKQMEKSLWYRQTTKRARRLVDIVRSVAHSSGNKSENPT